MSTNKLPSRSVRESSRFGEQSNGMVMRRAQQSLNGHRLWTHAVHGPSAVLNCPYPQSCHAPELFMNLDGRENVRVIACPYPSHGPSLSRFLSDSFRPMNSFDPATVRQAVADFTPRRPQRFQDLIPAKEVIAELRQKRASYRAIAELLTKHCLPTSKTAIAGFCHHVLGEIVRPHRRQRRKRTAPAAPPQPTEVHPPDAPGADSDREQSPQPRVRGPRIAHVRMRTPEAK